MTSDADRVLRLLRNAAATQTDIARACDMDLRAVQAACEELRRAGHPVISSGAGMRLAQTSAEALSCAAALRRRAVTQLLTSRALRRTGQRMKEAEDTQKFWAYIFPTDVTRTGAA
jgi:thiamine pyrophosphate-dependent acetolactate synthase large subunit-like protein